MKVFVTGASSQVGHFLCPRLLNAGHSIVCLSRKKHCSDDDGALWVEGDLEQDLSSLWSELRPDIWVNIAALPLALPHLQVASAVGVKRFIAFSTTSVLTKRDSANQQEQDEIAAILAAEEEIAKRLPGLGIDWTVFRPTMIYGCDQDRNVAFLASMIHRLGFFPLPGQDGGLRQPVHADDLAQACVDVLVNASCFNKCYILSGGEVLRYRKLVERVFIAMGREPKVLAIPVPLYKAALSLLRCLSPRFSFLKSSMVDRIAADMAFDHQLAHDDFGFSPRDFMPPSLSQAEK